MSDLSKIATAEPIYVTDGSSQAVAVATSSPPSSSAVGLVVREAAQGQQTMANSAPVVVASNTSAIPVSGTVTANAGTGNFIVVGNLTNNNAAPSTNNLGVLPAVATTAAPTYTTGDMVALSTDTAGNLRVTGSLSSASGLVSTNNSSTATLGSNAVFTGTGDNTTNYAAVAVQVFANQNSAAGGLSLQFGNDNTNWDFTTTYTITASTVFNIDVAPQACYFRIVYTNGASAQGTFRLQTVLKSGNASPIAPSGAQPTGTSTPGAMYIQGVTGMNALSENITQIAGSTVATAATGIIKVGVTDSAGTSITLGQNVMASSLPVVIASDQSVITTQCYEPAVVNGTITTATSSVTATTGATTGCEVSIHGTYAGVNISFQVSDDSGTTYYPVEATRIDETGSETTSGVLTANTSRMWNVYYGNVTNFRVLATAWTSGTATINISMTTGSDVRGVIVNGNTASGTTDVGQPVKVGGPAYTAAPTTVTTGQRQNIFLDTMGRMMVSAFPRQAMYNAVITLTATTTSTTLIPAQGAGVFSDMIAFTLSNSSAAATLVLIGDGTVNYSFWLPAGNTIQQSYFTPISQGGANTAWMVQTTTSVSSVYVTAHFVKTSN